MNDARGAFLDEGRAVGITTPTKDVNLLVTRKETDEDTVELNRLGRVVGLERPDLVHFEETVLELDERISSEMFMFRFFATLRPHI